jgi:hypothetical protein
MKKTILKLSLVSFMLFGTNTFADTDKTKEMTEVDKKIKGGTTTVDEALETKPINDGIKGGGKSKDKIHDINVSLASIKESYQISRKNLNFPPYRCFIYHDDGNETEIGTSNEFFIDFKINKSLLKVGDTIVVTNKLDFIDENHPIKKEIVEQIEILK